jgi:hypothetical protein
MLKLSMKNHRVVIDPASLTLEPLREIWFADKSTIKKEATDLLTYIHICSQVDQDAPFAKVDPTEVGALTKREIFGKYEYEFKGKFDQEFMDDAVLRYQLAYDSPEQSAVRVFDKKIHEMNRLIDETAIVITPVAAKGGVEYVSNFPILNKMMQDMTKIRAAREAMHAAVLKQKNTNSVRGQRQVSFLEKRRADMRKAGVIKDSPPGKDEESDDEEANF